MRRFIVLVVILVPSLALAQQYNFEITPTLGYRWGTGIEASDRAYEFKDVDVDIDASGSFGLRFGLDLGKNLQFEGIWNRQEGQLEDRDGLISEWFVPLDPDGDGVPNDYRIYDRSELLDTRVTYIHAGLLWHWGKGPDRKYLASSIGVTRFDVGVPLHTEVGVSLSVGAGYKLKLSERLALRFEGRVYWTRLDEGAIGVQNVDVTDGPDCDIPCTITWGYPSSLVQFEAMMGLAIKL